MAHQNNPKEATSPHASKSLPPMTPQEEIAHIEKCWSDRREHIQQIGGWGGRDLRNQEDLLSTVMGIEDDVTQLLRYVTDIFRYLARVTDLQPSDRKGIEGRK